MNTIAHIFKALSDTTRLRIVNALIKAGTALCICELVDTLGLPQYNISRHMKELKIAGLVKEEKAGKFVFYSLIDPESEFDKHFRKTLSLMNGPESGSDGKRLRQRLSLREHGKCVVGMRKCTC